MKMFSLVFVACLLCGVTAYAADAQSVLNAPVVEASDLLREMEQNKFAFKKKYSTAQIVVIGFVDEVGEGRFDEMKFKAPKMPDIKLEGLFHAFLAEPGDLDLADIKPDDIFLAVCSEISEGMAGLYVKAVCKPGLLGERQGDSNIFRWCNSDKSVQDIILTPEGQQLLCREKAN